MSFKKLQKQMAARGVSIADLASELGITTRTIENRFSGKYDFGFTEMTAIRERFFPDLRLEDLSDDFSNTELKLTAH